jgi:hypothetical protein
MAEQLANLYGAASPVTLASNYTIGSGSISVSSATGAPTTGTFSLTILNASTGAVILIFRVTSVSGTTFSGAAEGTDTNAPSGSIVVGTMMTAAAVAQIKEDAIAPSTNANLVLAGPSSGLAAAASFRALVAADLPSGGGAFIQALTAPVAANFTPVNYNTGSGVTTTQANLSSPVTAITIRQEDPSSTGNMAALGKSTIASTFTVTAAFSIAGDIQGSLYAGLWLNDGSTKSIVFGNNLLAQNDGNFYVIYSYTTFLQGSGGGVYTPTGAGNFGGPLLWLRVQETASARNYYVSSDGVTFFLYYTESNTAHFTTAKYGFAVMFRTNVHTGDGGITCYSFTETNP